MWFVFYSYFWYENWWNVKFYSGEVKVIFSIWNELYYNVNFFKGDYYYYERDFGFFCKFCGLMIGFVEVILEIYVFRK